MKNKRILVTGGAGFVGSNLCNYFDKEGIDYLAVDDLGFGYKGNLNNLDKFRENGFEELSVDCINSFDVLLHLACANIIYSQENCLQSFRINAFNTFNLFKSFKGKIIYTSTCSVYGMADNFPINEDAPMRVNNVYDQSKLLSEMYLQLRGNQTTLRLSNVYGKNQRPDHPFSGVIGKLIGNAMRKEKFKIIGDGLATRDYTYIDDVVKAIVMAIEKPALNRPINIGTGKETNTLKLAYMISEIMKVPFNVDFIPERSIDIIERRCLNVCCARELLGWEPETDLEKGIKLTIKELKK